MNASERRKKRRALLLALFSTGLLTLFFLILVRTPPVEPPKASGYLLVEFGPGGQNLPPPPAPKPKETPAPRVTRPVPKAPSPPKPKPKPKPKPPPAAKPKPKPVPAPRADSAPALPKSKAPPTPTAPEGPPLVPRAPEAPAPPEAAPAAPLAAPAPPEPTAAPEAPGPVEAPAPGPAPRVEAPAAPPAPPGPGGAEPALPEPEPPAPAPPPRAAGPELPVPALPGPAPPTPQPGPARGAAPGKGAAHYTVRLAVPLLVSVDNAHAAFPQRGFGLARRVYEVPVEGGVTRLLFETRGGEEGLVGPVRSARLYMLDLVDALQAFLVHVGGSPLAQKRIEEGGYVTFDGLYDRARFVRTRDRRPPHNAYADLGKVRSELRRLGLDRVRVQKGAAYLPPEDAPPGGRFMVRFGPDYQSGFRYEPKGYRWVRNGASTPVFVDAVAVLYVEARVKDEVGRLELALTRGEGALYLKGRYLPVRWRLVEGGFALHDAGGEALDLTPYRVWFVLVPPWARME